ncbi:MAG: HAD-IA family hydrolase [Planctomycetes bacterium]|nr:HAD-IA family hydrolase [Planctomycetota bacterium]
MIELDGIFLDMYGTLTAGDRQAVEAVCETIVRDTGIDLSAHELSITWGERFFHCLDFANGDQFMTLADLERKTLTDTMSALGVKLDPEPYVASLMHYWRNPPLQPDVNEFLGAIRFPICLVSNADRDDAVAALSHNGITLDHVVTSEDARSYKPDREIFEMALGETGWRRDRVIHVGDSLHSDVGGAIIAGIRSGWVNRAHRIHDIGTHTPDFEFADLMGLAALLSPTMGP